MSDSVGPHRWQPTRLPRPWDSPGKNTGVGCHFLTQCMKVKIESESEVLSDSLQPHGLQPTRLLCPWDFLGKSTGVGCHCLLLSSQTLVGEKGIVWLWKSCKSILNLWDYDLVELGFNSAMEKVLVPGPGDDNPWEKHPEEKGNLMALFLYSRLAGSLIYGNIQGFNFTLRKII